MMPSIVVYREPIVQLWNELSPYEEFDVGSLADQAARDGWFDFSEAPFTTDDFEQLFSPSGRQGNDYEMGFLTGEVLAMYDAEARGMTDRSWEDRRVVCFAICATLARFLRTECGVPDLEITLKHSLGILGKEASKNNFPDLVICGKEDSETSRKESSPWRTGKFIGARVRTAASLACLGFRRSISG